MTFSFHTLPLKPHWNPATAVKQSVIFSDNCRYSLPFQFPINKDINFDYLNKVRGPLTNMQTVKR